MPSFKSLVYAACVTSLGSLSAWAEGTGADGHIRIFNSTPGFTITGFYTNSGHGWSRDWLMDVTLTPGEGATAQFRTAPPNCHQRVRAGWLSASGHEFRGHPIKLNICNVSNVYFAQEETFFD
ncbi:MAG: hypothetical protein AAF641_12270 [Pseudomonadota bacterium]